MPRLPLRSRSRCLLSDSLLTILTVLISCGRSFHDNPCDLFIASSSVSNDLYNSGLLAKSEQLSSAKSSW
uniref:Putative secreted protein n=1 Tax=Panstrongylus lignarius TaxID=156445 RepID=A0A224Y660_9HEMI